MVASIGLVRRPLLGALLAVVVLVSGCGTAAASDGAAAAKANSTASPAAVGEPIGPACTCGHTAAAATLAAGSVGNLDVGGAYAVTSAGADGGSTQAYMSIVNGGTGSTRLVAASSTKATKVGFADDAATVTSIALPAEQTTTLAPAAYHLQATGLSKALRVGDTLPVTLHFSGGATLLLDLPVSPR